jgi:hypothetical protein
MHGVIEAVFIWVQQDGQDSLLACAGSVRSCLIHLLTTR